MNAALLREGARIFGLEPNETEVERFGLYLSELQRWNRSINLTAIKKADQIVVKHFVDSLSIVPLPGKGERLLDVGSGAGLPGLAIAIMRADLSITSLDAIDKKVRFQRHVVRLLGLDHVTVVHKRIEQLAEEQAGLYDVVTSRAFRDLERFAQLGWKLLRPGGRLIAMMAGADAVQSSGVLKISDQYGLEHIQSNRYDLPCGMGARMLVVLRRGLT